MNTEYYQEKYIECLRKRKDELVKLPMPKADREAYCLFFETGNRLAYEKIYFDRREYLTVFGLMSVLDNMQPDKLFYVIDEILNEPTWVLPAHGSPKHFDGEVITIDLFAAETAGSMAEIVFLVFDNANKNDKDIDFSICTRLLINLRKRIFDVFLSKCPCDWWENAGMNWAAVCSGNVAAAAYYARKLQSILSLKLHDKRAEKFDEYFLSEDEYNEIMERAVNSMICYLGSMGGDGACSEGVGYYKYGMEYFLKFYEILRNEKMQEYQEYLDKIGDFHETALFLQRVYLGGGNSVNFSDCMLKNKTKIGMLCILSDIYDDVELDGDFSQDGSLKFDTEFMEILGGEECHRWLGAYSDYIWVKNYGEKLRTADRTDGSFFIFKEAQWYIKRWDNGSAFYIKGGHNDESHNHNDVGSFGYIFNGQEIFCELGAGEYTKDYFGENRYEILCNSSRGHNVPVIEGLYQKNGRAYCTDYFYADEKSVTVSFGGAYSDDQKYTLIRKVEFNDDGSFCISDTIEGAKNVSERLISRQKPSIDTSKSDVRVEIEEEIHANHSGQKEKVYIVKMN